MAWSFLERVMIKLGFGMNWIRRVMNYISSVSFSFKVNGEVSGSVIYLFYVLMLFLPYCPKLLLRRRLVGQEFAIRLLERLIYFLRMIVLFAKATQQECSKIAEIISVYERASGQKVNLGKTKVAFSKCVPIDRRNAIVETLGIREVEKHEKYFGLPTIIGKSKKTIFAVLKERIWKKLNGWKEWFMSRPGKEILIKAVAQAIPTYMMSIFKIPESLIDEIHSLLCRFWWGLREKLCTPKSKGGMGF
ncbi:uncharacterized protein LOC110735946 [Chenopodium quinoa]|uniref:uncharacterized protein LOC110735946 n=1 Tax=Chenopodium quinoa TaxID=63459 RepID=UPI000B777AE9|nr:uncharacterized protein LOC110735946 [Chenopodium quinoa]